MRHEKSKQLDQPRKGWRNSAKCAGQPALWDLDKDGRYGHRIGRYVQVLAAKLCEGCPVIRDCAVDGMDPLAVSVVRGGVYLPLKISGRSRLAMLEEVAAREAVTQ